MEIDTLPCNFGPFVVEEAIGAGGMGAVFRARTREPYEELPANEVVALKFLGSARPSRESKERFAREAEIGRSVRGARIVRGYGLVQESLHGSETTALVMEYVDGSSLRDLTNRTGIIPEPLARMIAVDVAVALADLHAVGVVHRDIKPSNILITHTNQVKVCDLGVAHVAGADSQLTEANAFIGTRAYAAPEQMTGRTITPRADLFSLGACLLEATTGISFRECRQLLPGLPSVGARAGATDATEQPGATQALSPFLRALLTSLLQLDADLRFADAADLAQVLREGEESTWYQQRGPLADDTPLWRQRLGTRQDHFVGRTNELVSLKNVLHSAMEGRGGAALVRGEAGIGKSRLLDAFFESLTLDSPPRILVVTNTPGRTQSFAAFGEMLRAYFGRDDALRIAERHLSASPGPLAAVTSVIFEEGAADTAALDALQTGLVRLLQGVARDHPTILVIDDLHFVEEDGRALFLSLAAASHGCPLLVVGTTRETGASWEDEFVRLPHATVVDVAPLGADEQLTLVKRATGRALMSEREAQAVASRSDGNPYFLLELADAPESGGTVPGSLRELLQNKASRAASDDIDLLQAASCIGNEFTTSLLSRVVLGNPSAHDTLGLIRQLATLVPSGFLEATGRTFRFRRHLLQEVIHASVPGPLQSHYHGLIADELMANLQPDAVEITSHLLAADRSDEARPFLGPAIKRLREQYEWNEARRLLSAFLSSHPDDVDMRITQLDLIRTSGDEASGKTEIEDIAACAARNNNADLEIDALHALSSAHLMERDFDAAQAVLQRASEKATPTSRAKTALIQGTVSLHAGNIDDARARFDAVLATDDINPSIRARALGSLALLPPADGQHDHALQHLEQCLAIAQESGNEELERSALGNLSYVLGIQGQHERATDCARQLLAKARAVGNRLQENFALSNLGTLEKFVGNLEAGLRYTEECERIAREVQDTFGASLAVTNQASLHRIFGATDRAQALLNRLLRDADLSDARLAVLVYRQLSRVLELQGDLEQAIQYAEKAVALADTPDEQVGAAMVDLARLIQASDPARSDELLEQALEIADTVGSVKVECLARAGMVDAGVRPSAASDLEAQYDLLRDRLPITTRARVLGSLNEAGVTTFTDEAANIISILLASTPESSRSATLTANPRWIRLQNETESSHNAGYC